MKNRLAPLLALVTALLGLTGVVAAQPVSVVRLSDSSDEFMANQIDRKGISQDGRFVLSVLGDSSQVYRYDRTDGSRILVSQSTAGVSANGSFGGTRTPSLSGDGRFAVFSSDATNLVAGDTNNQVDIFLRDIDGGTTVAVSDVTTVSGTFNLSALITLDGSAVIYSTSTSNPSDPTLFKYSRLGGTTSPIGQPGDFLGAVSSDGRFVVVGRRIDDTTIAAFRIDTQDSTEVQVDVAPDGSEADNGAGFGAGGGAVSADGRYVAFLSSASNLVAGDTNEHDDIFFRDLTEGVTTRISVRADGLQISGDISLSAPVMSGDARFIVFSVYNSELVEGDLNEFSDIYLYDRVTGGLKEISANLNGTLGNGNSRLPAISDDGSYVAFDSQATNLTGEDLDPGLYQYLVGTGGAVTPDQCLEDTAKIEPGDCGCGFVDLDTDANGIADCSDIDGNTTPAKPTIRPTKRAMRISVAQLPEPNARLELLVRKLPGRSFTILRALPGKTKKKLFLQPGRYLVRVRFKRPNGLITQPSKRVRVRVRG